MDDLISRKAMREAMYHEAMEKDSNEQKWDGGCWIRYKMFERVIESLPSAEPKQKTGKWITKSDTNHYYTTWWYECSECGKYPPRDGYGQEVLSDYCPHCGCRMECEEE